jgi:hypothetical protein
MQAEKKKKTVGTRQGAQGQGHTDSQVARGQSPPSPTSEGRNVIFMLEPACRVRAVVACTREPGDMVLKYCLCIYIFFMNYMHGKFHVYFFSSCNIVNSRNCKTNLRENIKDACTLILFSNQTLPSTRLIEIG